MGNQFIISIGVMAEEASIVFTGAYVHFKLFDKPSNHSCFHYWKRIKESCEENDCLNVLVESFVMENLKLVDSLNYIDVFKELGLSIRFRIAIVNHEESAAEGIRFTETLLKNRAMLHGGIFESMDEAVHWLTHNKKVEQ